MKDNKTNTQSTDVEGMWQLFPYSRIYVPTRDPNVIAQATKFNMGIDKYCYAPVTKKNCENFIKLIGFIKEGLDCAKDHTAKDALLDIFKEFQTSLDIWKEVKTVDDKCAATPEVPVADENGCYY